ncbi:MAG: hypothetical protein AVDCRST_MAG96-2471, partial [uncultured Segetibacter sp.]
MSNIQSTILCKLCGIRKAGSQES